MIFCISINYLNFIYLLVAEDKENYHGKPMGKDTESSINAIQALIQNNGPHDIQLKSPIHVVAPPSTEKLALSTPPDYTLGEMVR